MGEHEIRHYPSNNQYRAGRLYRDVTIPLEDKYVEGLFRFSEETGTAFQIHYEIEDRLLAPLEAMLARYPGARVIWCHLGQIRFFERSSVYGPDYVRSLIDRFPNLHFDLAVGGPRSTYLGSGARQSTLFEYAADRRLKGCLKAEWRTLLNYHPERFLAASDIDPGRFRYLGRKIRRLRALILDELSETAQHKFAYRNAWRLITKRQWQS